MGFRISYFAVAIVTMMKTVAVFLALTIACALASHNDVEFSGAINYRTQVKWGASSQNGSIDLRGASCSFSVKPKISKLKVKWNTTVCGLKGPTSSSDKASMAKAFCAKQRELTGKGPITVKFRGKVESC